MIARPYAPTYRVLVIEPQRDIGFVLQRLLEFDRHEVARATDGLVGAELATSFKPDVVISAVDLPGQDCFAVARQIRRVLGETPFLIVATSYPQSEIEEAMKSAGFNLYLAKPFSREELQAALQQIRPIAVG